MSKKLNVMYGLAFAMVLTGALVIDGAPLVAAGMIAVSVVCIRIAERWST